MDVYVAACLSPRFACPQTSRCHTARAVATSGVILLGRELHPTTRITPSTVHEHTSQAPARLPRPGTPPGPARAWPGGQHHPAASRAPGPRPCRVQAWGRQCAAVILTSHALDISRGKGASVKPCTPAAARPDGPSVLRLRAGLLLPIELAVLHQVGWINGLQQLHHLLRRTRNGLQASLLGLLRLLCAPPRLLRSGQQGWGRLLHAAGDGSWQLWQASQSKRVYVQRASAQLQAARFAEAGGPACM